MGCNFTLNSLCYHPRTLIISKTEALIVTLVIPAEEKRFGPNALLANIAKGRTTESFRKNQAVFAQGTPCDSVFYIQKGKAKLTKKPWQKWWARLDRGSATL
jgi:hypothetical protein